MCIFCQIIQKQIPSTIVHENDQFLAFKDIDPKAPVHVLAIPKEHHESFETFPSENMASFSDFIKETAKILDIQENGYRLVSNIGENGFQTVHHLHFHILGGAKLNWPDLV